MRVFIDTSLWVYRRDKREPDKSRRIDIWLRALARKPRLHWPPPQAVAYPPLAGKVKP
ncbi:MAG: hypothetical protein JSR65_01720 [Proteobacteria bacterium]|nr:hypothetical protein [Pseudomonadota bacterium]